MPLYCHVFLLEAVCFTGIESHSMNVIPFHILPWKWIIWKMIQFFFSVWLFTEFISWNQIRIAVWIRKTSTSTILLLLPSLRFYCCWPLSPLFFLLSSFSLLALLASLSSFSLLCGVLLCCLPLLTFSLLWGREWNDLLLNYEQGQADLLTSGLFILSLLLLILPPQSSPTFIPISPFLSLLSLSHQNKQNKII